MYIYIYIYIYMHTKTYAYTYMHVCVYVCFFEILCQSIKQKQLICLHGPSTFLKASAFNDFLVWQVTPGLSTGLKVASLRIHKNRFLELGIVCVCICV